MCFAGRLRGGVVEKPTSTTPPLVFMGEGPSLGPCPAHMVIVGIRQCSDYRHAGVGELETHIYRKADIWSGYESLRFSH